ncbi:AAA family ATPase [Cryptosporangium arvum]|uniref:RecA/RadA recombinase n=1 Tax=Cryptosporangium arvum DSM 44712 TaxID=927661 RepID=A0A010ZS25_9ACTN|nr:AAA family ATPase [Cryptosporangium arvum]EXG80017.1 RecA/RadA recombinase [Cryptosporangium arvum DSM 44712]
MTTLNERLAAVQQELEAVEAENSQTEVVLEQDQVLYVDVAALLDGGLPEREKPTVLQRQDGNCLFYRRKVNVLFGDPEGGKTWVALAALVDVLTDGGKAVFIDLDHNGAGEILSRLIYLGAKPAELSDPERFRLAEPEDQLVMRATVADLCQWEPDAAVVDSVGELLPLMGASSNSPDDWTTVNRRILTPLANSGAAVIAVDHLPKSADARAAGPTGTVAKKRSINGASYRVYAMTAFAPGQGGAAGLEVEKDRPGGVREHCPMTGSQKQKAGVFRLEHRLDGAGHWYISDPVEVVREDVDADVQALDELVPPPRSKQDVKDRLKWGSDRAYRSLTRWRELRKEASASEADE